MGRMRSLRTRPRSSAPIESAIPSPASAATRSRVNSLPSTDAASMTVRSVGSSRSRRAASSAWIVGGTAIERQRVSLPAVAGGQDAVIGEHRDDLLDEERVALGHLEDPDRSAVD